MLFRSGTPDQSTSARTAGYVTGQTLGLNCGRVIY
jgi:hypothetical protein